MVEEVKAPPSSLLQTTTRLNPFTLGAQLRGHGAQMSDERGEREEE